MFGKPISKRSYSFFSRLNSTRRLALIAPLIFGLAVVLGYTATAKAPAFLKRIVSPPSAPAPLVERATPVHPMSRMLKAASMFDAVVFTDKQNYQPGETAVIFGYGFAANELVTVQVVHIDETAEPGEGHEPWTVAADDLGNFTTTWYVNPDDSAGKMFLLTAIGQSSGLTAEHVFTDGSANLDTCSNGPTSAPVQCTGANWDNGNLNGSKSHYFEGDSVPYRTVFSNLIVGHTYTITIEYDTTQGGDHAFDYLTSFNRTEPSPGNNPCTQKQGGSIVTLCDPTIFVTTPIPNDPNVAAGQDGIPTTGDDITQIPGVFTLYNGNALSVVNPGSPYTLSGSYAGNSSTAITVQFNATDVTAVLAWAGHISTRLNWGPANSAIAINGSPYHMRLTELSCSGVGEVCNVGNQDHQLASDAVFFPIQLTIIKETNPDDAQLKTFNYTTSGANLGPFTLTPPNGTTPDQKTFSLLDTSARTVTESDPHAAAPQFNLTSLTCSQTDGGLGTGSLSTNTGTRTVSFTPKEGQSISCTYVNTEDLEATRGRIIVDKVTVPSGDPTSFQFTSTYGSGFSLKDTDPPNNSGLISPGNYSVSETVPAGWDGTSQCVSSIGDTESAGSLELDAGETITCTFTNTKRGHIIVDKVTVPSGDPTSFDFTAGGGSYANFSLTDAAPPNDQTLVPGTYSVSETVPAGWDKTSSPCVSSKGDTETIGALHLDAGETITCTFTNTKRGHIIVDKVTVPSGDTQSFDFTAGGGSYANFSLTDAAPPNDQTLVPGTYSVSETAVNGWDLTSSPCVSSKGDSETIGALHLDAGETITCTFTNTKRGHIIVDKVTNPSGDTQSFNFTAGGGSYANFSLTDAAAPNDQTLVPGNYTVSEGAVAGWDLTSSPCVSSKGDTETIGALHLDAGETITCTFTNTKRGHIIVDKVTNPSGDPKNFYFTAGGGSYANFSLTDAAPPNDQTLAPGNYSVSETVPAGWDLTSSPCVSSIGDTETAGALELDPGETITCTFTNTKRGHIIVDKVTAPSGDPQSFDFTAGGGSYANFSLTDAAPPNDQTLVPGTYSVSETAVNGWDLTSSPCVSSKGDSETIGALHLDPGETITCTFTNTKRGHIIVDKVTSPSGDPQSFNFTAGGGSYANFSLTDAAPPNDQTLVPGTYSVSETAVAGWDLTSSPCVSSKGDSETIGALHLDAGETITCTFNNAKRGHIIVDKITNPSGDPASFNFDAVGGSYADFSLTDAASPNDQTLVPGNYSVSEMALVGWDLTSSPCVSSKGDTETIGALHLDAGETITCRFYNRKRARLIVEKQTDPDGASGSFTFTGTAAGSIGDGGNIPVGNLIPGTYTSTENNPTPNFDLTSIVCNDANSTGDVPSRTATFRLEAGETVKCTFTNTQRGMAKVVKTFQGGALGTNTFTFQLRSGASAASAGTILESGTATGAGGGVINFTTKLVPGTTYQMCEQMQPGWLTTLGPPLYSVFNPSGDNSVVCTDFTVTAGETKTFTIDNQPPPGGMGLTIGFWKNWASCANSNGGQKPTLDKTLQLGDLTLGSLVLHDSNANINIASDCQQVVNLLNKLTISGGKKMASDPIFNMVAQLVAADLNVLAGAGQSVNAMKASNCAHALLVAINFNGNTYNKLTAAQTAQANCLATQLDNYNNNKSVGTCTGCP